MQQKIVILISGNGSNMQAIVKANIPNANISAVISNQAQAAGLVWAQNNGLNTELIESKDYNNRLEFDLRLINLIDQYQPDLVVLAGFMRILGAEFCRHYTAKLINIHPSLLPSFPGLNTHQNAIDAGCKITGCTVHFVTPELDNGPIIAQAAVAIAFNDTVKSLSQKVLNCEHLLYPQVIADFVAGNLSIVDNKVNNKNPVNSPHDYLLAY